MKMGCSVSGHLVDFFDVSGLSTGKVSGTDNIPENQRWVLKLIMLGVRIVAIAILLIESTVPAVAQAVSVPDSALASLRQASAPSTGFMARIVSGNPTSSGPFVMLLRVDDGRWIPPHTHNVAKRLRVIEGELLVGHGELIATDGLRRFRVGDEITMPGDMAHFEGARGLTIIELTADGPFTTRWLEPPNGIIESMPMAKSARTRRGTVDQSRASRLLSVIAPTDGLIGELVQFVQRFEK